MNKFRKIKYFEDIAGDQKKYNIKTSIPEYNNWNVVNILSVKEEVITINFLNRGFYGGIGDKWIDDTVILEVPLEKIVDFEEHDDKGFTNENINNLFTFPKKNN